MNDPADRDDRLTGGGSSADPGVPPNRWVQERPFDFGDFQSVPVYVATRTLEIDGKLVEVPIEPPTT